MSTFTCPQGHPSTTGDFCDYCGARMVGGPVVAPTPVPGPSVPAGGRTCPHCATPSAAMGRFCEGCGFDFVTEKAPAPASAVALPAPLWTATVLADRAYFEANDLVGIDFPVLCPERSFVLTPPQVRIGRASGSKGTHPEMDLSAVPLDPGVSHSHAVLTMGADGVWMVSDLGSTNGTFLNDAAEPLAVGKLTPLADGDRVHLGAWTTITVRAPDTGTAPG